MTFTDDTICAPATAVGSGAINIIRISGPRAFELADSIVSFAEGQASDAPGYTLKYGIARTPDGQRLDDVLVAVFRAPRSYTGEDSVEIYCHASSYIVSTLLDMLCSRGCRPAQAGEFTRRAFVGGKMDLAQAEAVADLIASKSAAAHRIAMSQMKGSFSRRLAELREKMKSITALVELELDFGEEEVEFASRGQLMSLLDETIAEVERLASSFRAGNAIKSGIPVAIVGAANSGKSTLLNALVGEERALVSDIAGTTRDTIEESVTLEGIIYRFIDTAGLRESNDTVEKMGIERAVRKLSEAMIVIEMLDGAAPLDELQRSHSLIESKLLPDQKHLIVRGKIDIYDAINPEEFPTMDRSYGMFNLKYPAFGTYDLDPVALAEKLGCRRAAAGAAGVADGCSTVAACDGVGDGAAVAAGLVSGSAGCDEVGSGAGPRIIDISAKTGEGMDALRSAIAECGRSLTGSDPSEVIVANERHYAALTAASASLRAARNGLGCSCGGPGCDGGGDGAVVATREGGGDGAVPAGCDVGGQFPTLSTELVAEELRSAISDLGAIVGEISTDEVLGDIFGKFCIGK